MPDDIVIVYCDLLDLVVYSRGIIVSIFIWGCSYSMEVCHMPMLPELVFKDFLGKSHLNQLHWAITGVQYNNTSNIYISIP